MHFIQCIASTSTGIPCIRFMPFSVVEHGNGRVGDARAVESGIPKRVEIRAETADENV